MKAKNKPLTYLGPRKVTMTRSVTRPSHLGAL